MISYHDYWEAVYRREKYLRVLKEKELDLSERRFNVSYTCILHSI